MVALRQVLTLSAVGFAAGNGLVDRSARPTTKVINLLKDMESSLEAEAKEDEDTYEKMQCWCKSNGEDKAKSIESAEARIKGLEARTEELAATSSRLASEIATSEDEVVHNEKALDTAAAL